MAQKKISQLVAVTGPTGPDVLPIVSGGATKKVSLTTISSFVREQVMYQGPTGPAGASAGSTWLNTTDGRYHVRYEGLWVEVGGQYVP